MNRLPIILYQFSKSEVLLQNLKFIIRTKSSMKTRCTHIRPLCIYPMIMILPNNVRISMFLNCCFCFVDLTLMYFLCFYYCVSFKCMRWGPLLLCLVLLDIKYFSMHQFYRQLISVDHG